MKEEFKECPYCAEDIKFAAKKCKHCGEFLEKEEFKEEEKSINDQERYGDHRDWSKQDSVLIKRKPALAKMEKTEVTNDQAKYGDHRDWTQQKNTNQRKQTSSKSIEEEKFKNDQAKYGDHRDWTQQKNTNQRKRTSGQSEVIVRHNQPMSGGQVFFRVVWITLLVIFIWVVVQLGACAALLSSLG